MFKDRYLERLTKVRGIETIGRFMNEFNKNLFDHNNALVRLATQVLLEGRPSNEIDNAISRIEERLAEAGNFKLAPIEDDEQRKAGTRIYKNLRNVVVDLNRLLIEAYNIVAEESTADNEEKARLYRYRMLTYGSILLLLLVVGYISHSWGIPLPMFKFATP